MTDGAATVDEHALTNVKRHSQCQKLHTVRLARRQEPTWKSSRRLRISPVSNVYP